MKSQTVRLVDVFFIGPFMIYIGLRDKNPVFTITSVFIGMATIVYNGFNYITYKQNKDIVNLDHSRSASIGVRG